jgi:multiple sugar transport system permease protein
LANIVLRHRTQSRTAAAWRASRRSQKRLGHLLLHVVLIAFGVLMLLPFAWLVSTSLKEQGTELVVPPVWIPNPIVWQNYPKALSQLPFIIPAPGTGWHSLLNNTLFITGATLLGALTTASMAAYAFSRLRFRWRSALFAVCLSTLMLPNVVTLIPQFILFKDLGWINTFAPLIVPSFFGGGAFNIFLIRQFFMTIPYELEEASRIDGASSLRIWWSIMLPLSKPALGTVAIFGIIFHWNDFLGPLIYLNSQQYYTLALGLQSFQGAYGGDFNLMMAASTVMIIPIMVLFFFAQRFFMQGIALTGMGGR